jgi:hypothetical protein
MGGVMVNTMPPAIQTTTLVCIVVSVLVIVIHVAFTIGQAASISIQEKITEKSKEGRLAGPALVGASEQTLHLCWVAG